MPQLSNFHSLYEDAVSKQVELGNIRLVDPSAAHTDLRYEQLRPQIHQDSVSFTPDQFSLLPREVQRRLTVNTISGNTGVRSYKMERFRNALSGIVSRYGI